MSTSWAVTVIAGCAVAEMPDRSTVPSGARAGAATGVPSGSVTRARDAAGSTCERSMSVSRARV
ncbi:hypothetical protein ACFQ1I_40695 [Kitasatospora arboriphila]